MLIQRIENTNRRNSFLLFICFFCLCSPFDEAVWLQPSDVAAGKDTVVEAATRWINQQP
jgi:hypothetical protein